MGFEIAAFAAPVRCGQSAKSLHDWTPTSGRERRCRADPPLVGVPPPAPIEPPVPPVPTNCPATRRPTRTASRTVSRACHTRPEAVRRRGSAPDAESSTREWRLRAQFVSR